VIEAGEIYNADLLDLTREPRGRLDPVSHRSVIQAIGYTLAAECEPV